MNAITFRTVVQGEQVIRPPADVVLPEGPLEVTVTPVARGLELTTSAREAANARLRKCRVSLGHATGIDNASIDADLARVYGESAATDHGEAPR
jgi:hypothetical protein